MHTLALMTMVTRVAEIAVEQAEVLAEKQKLIGAANSRLHVLPSIDSQPASRRTSSRRRAGAAQGCPASFNAASRQPLR